MGTVLVSVLPYIIGSAVVPLQVIIGLLLLKSPKQGLFKAVAYVGRWNDDHPSVTGIGF